MSYVCIIPTQIIFIFYYNTSISCAVQYDISIRFKFFSYLRLAYDRKPIRILNICKGIYNHFSAHYPKNCSFILENNLELEPNL